MSIYLFEKPLIRGTMCMTPGLRSTHYEEVSQTFKAASEAGVEFWEIQMDFRPEGVTLNSVNKSTDL